MIKYNKFFRKYLINFLQDIKNIKIGNTNQECQKSKEE